MAKYLLIILFSFLNSISIAQKNNSIDEKINKISIHNFNEKDEILIKHLDTQVSKFNKAQKNNYDFIKIKQLYYSSNYNEALKKIDEIINRFQRGNEINKSEDAKVYKGLINYKLGNAEEALEIFLKIKTKNLTETSFYYVNLGGLYYHFNNVQKTLEFANLAEKEALKNKNNETLIKVYNLIAATYNFSNDSVKAIEYAKKALQIAKENNDNLAVVLCSNNLSIYLNGTKNYQESLKYLSEAKPYINKIQNTFLKNRHKFFYANTLFKMGEINESEKINDSLLSQNSIVVNDDNLASSLLLKADINKYKKKYKDAIYFYNEGILKANKTNKITTESSGYKSLSETYEEFDDSKNALFYYKKHVAIENKIDSLELSKELKNMEIKNAISSYEQKLKLKNQEIELLNLKSTKSKFQLFGLICLVFGAVIFVIRQRKINSITKKNALYVKQISELREQTLENKVSFTSNQIVEFAIQIEDQNKLLYEFKNKLSSLLKNLKKTENTEEVKNLLFDVNTALEHNNEKIKLNTQISNATDDFLFNIKEKFPDLNEKEIQIITYLRLNYKTKQIASLLAINNQSVNNYRASIRKKMNVPKEQNLNQFLIELI